MSAQRHRKRVSACAWSRAVCYQPGPRGTRRSSARPQIRRVSHRCGRRWAVATLLRPSSALAEIHVGRDLLRWRIARGDLPQPLSSVPGTLRVTGPSTDTYRIVGSTRSTISVKRPAASIRRAFHDPAEVSTHASPPGSYWYQIGKVRGPRPCPADTDKAAMCGSAKNSSRSCTDNLLSAMVQSLSKGTDNLARQPDTLPSTPISLFLLSSPARRSGWSVASASPLQSGYPVDVSPRPAGVCGADMPVRRPRPQSPSEHGLPRRSAETERQAVGLGGRRGRRPGHGTSRRLWLGWETTRQPEIRLAARMGSRQADVRGLDHLGPGDSRGLRRDLRGQVRAAGPRSHRRCARRSGRGSACARVRGRNRTSGASAGRTGDRRARHRVIPAHGRTAARQARR